MRHHDALPESRCREPVQGELPLWPPSYPPEPPCPPEFPDPPPEPPCPPQDLLPQVRAYKQVKGGPLRAGQFEFLLERADGTVLARGRNDANGWVHLCPRAGCLPPCGEWLTLREALPPPPGWKADRTRYRVFLRPGDPRVHCRGPAGPLEGAPVFTNLACACPSISGMKRTATGRPIPGWKILLHREEDCDAAPPLAVQRTDCRGRYAFEGLPRGRYRVTEAPRRGWRPVGCSRYSVTLGGEPVTGLDFVNEPTAEGCDWPEG